MKHPRIPPFANKLFRWFCKDELFEELEGDLEESFFRNKELHGLKRAKRIYRKEVLRMVRPSVFRRSESKPIVWASLFANYSLVTFRNISKNKLFSTINIVGLAMSMTIGLFAVAFASEMYRYDSFHEHHDRIFRIENDRIVPDHDPRAYATTSIVTAERLKDFAGFEKIVAFRNGFYGDVSAQEKTLQINGQYASEDFFEVFTFPLRHGNANSALSEPYSVVVTEQLAIKLFSKTNVIGEVIDHDNEKFTITGVFEELPRTSHLQFDALASLVTLKSDPHHHYGMTRWDAMWSNYVYVVLRRDADLDQVDQNLRKIELSENEKLEHFEISLNLTALADIFPGEEKYNQTGAVMPAKNIERVMILALIVLLSACFNYTNLSHARSFKRAKEIGIRKVVGASRHQLFGQFIFESVVISLLSFTLAFLAFTLSRSFLLQLDPYMADTTTLELTKGTVLLFLLLAIIVGVGAGLVPALILAKLKASRILKGIHKMKVGRGFGLLETMTGVQFIFSMGFTILVVLGYKQYHYATHFDLGYKTANILNVEIQDNDPTVLKSSFSKLPEVQNVSASSYILNSGATSFAYRKLQGSEDSVKTCLLNVSSNYLETMQHRLVAGSGVDLTKGKTAIVNERFVKLLGVESPSTAIGLLLDDGFTIIGVVEDFHYGTLFDNIDPFMFRTGSNFQYLNLRVQSDNMVETIKKLEGIWSTVDQKHQFRAVFYDNQIAEVYYGLFTTLKTFGLLAFIAITISILGLLGMAVYSAESRLKELAIRKVLGASIANVVLLLSKSFLPIFIIATLIAIPLSYSFYEKVILQNMRYSIEIGFWELASGSLIIIVIALLTISSQTFKAAKTNPATNLRNE